MKTDLDDEHVWASDRWSADPCAQDTVAVCLVNDRLVELLPNGDVYGYHAETGRVFTGGNFDPKPWNLGWEGYNPPAKVSDGEWHHTVTTVGVGGHKLYLDGQLVGTGKLVRRTRTSTRPLARRTCFTRRTHDSDTANRSANRVDQFRVVTTILDESIDGEQIGGLYERRWQGELDLRSIKSVMKMDVLRCKSPEMVGKEIWAHLLAYNLRRLRSTSSRSGMAG